METKTIYTAEEVKNLHPKFDYNTSHLWWALAHDSSEFRKFRADKLYDAIAYTDYEVYLLPGGAYICNDETNTPVVSIVHPTRSSKGTISIVLDELRRAPKLIFDVVAFGLAIDSKEGYRLLDDGTLLLRNVYDTDTYTLVGDPEDGLLTFRYEGV